MSENRIRIEKQLGKSINPNSIIKTNNVNEPQYLEIAGVDKYFGTDASGNAGVFDLPVGVITGTYSDFELLIYTNSLKQGSFYLMTDYETIYDQPDYDNTGSIKSTLTLKVGATEPILLLATSSNTFAKEVWSTVYPKDKLQYDISINTTFFSASPCKGRIVERIDEWNNRTDYDHRVVQFIRYDNGSGVYNVVNDNGNTAQEFLTFGTGYNNGAFVVDNYIGDMWLFRDLVVLEFPNNVFLAAYYAYFNKLGELNYNNTFGDYNNSNTWGDDNKYNTWGNGNSSNTWGNGNYSNTWGNDNYYNTWSNGNNSNTWGNGNNYNTWGDGNYSNTWGDGNYYNTWGDHNTSNLLDTTQPMNNKVFGSNIVNKDFTAEAYMYNNDYEVKIAKASDGNVYARYFNGLIDSINLIP